MFLRMIVGLVSVMDRSMKFMYIFLIASMVLLTVLHHFMKNKADKWWFLLCIVPLVVFAVFYYVNFTVGDPTLALQRYMFFGMAAFLIALWGLSGLLKRSFPVYTVLMYITTLGTLFCNIIMVWAVISRPYVGNYSRCGWTESFEGAIDSLEEAYVLRYWKEIDFDGLREELVPRVREAEANNDEEAFVMALYDLKYQLADGHVRVRGKRGPINSAMAELAGNDYGLSMFRADTGEIIAVMVDDSSEAYRKGIRNGTVITKWDGEDVDSAAEKVRCIDEYYSIQSVENEYIFQPLYLAGQGGDTVSVTFIGDDSAERTVSLSASGDYLYRRRNAMRKFYGDHKFCGSNYYTCMLDDNTGYLRITAEDYTYETMDVVSGVLHGFSQKLFDDVSGRLRELETQGMDRIIIDLRDNNGGYGFESRTIAAMFTNEPLENDLSYVSRGKYINLKGAESLGLAEWDDIPVVVLVNAETSSAGEWLTNYLKGKKNVSVIGNSCTWGSAQSTGGYISLSGGDYEMLFPIVPSLGTNGLPAVDTAADRKAQLTLDYQITYTKDELAALFENSDRDIELDAARAYIAEK